MASAQPEPTSARRSEPTGAALLEVACYIPRNRIARETIGATWGAPSLPGERAVAGRDEDAITMAVEAAERCLRGRDRSRIDALYFASTTAPYLEHQSAATIAAALDLRDDVLTADFSGSLRAGTSALRAARDAVVSTSAREVLVVASDRRVARPETALEQLLGDGAAAVLVGPDGPDALAGIEAMASVNEDVVGGWRRKDDRYLQTFSPKHEVAFGFIAVLERAMRLVAPPEDGAQPRLAVPSPDGRAHIGLARRLGVAAGRVADPQTFSVGALGTAAPFLALAGALENAEPGDTILVGAAGEGADAASLMLHRPLSPSSWRASKVATERLPVASYGDFIRANGLMETITPRVETSPIRSWRERRQTLSLRGMACGSCGYVQYPAARLCRRCRSKDTGVDVSLGRTGTVFAFTLDHVVAATYLSTPVARVILDLDGGGRVPTQLTDCTPAEVKTGMPVELTFRLMNEGSTINNYYWKARPAEREVVTAPA